MVIRALSGLVVDRRGPVPASSLAIPALLCRLAQYLPEMS